MNFRLSDDVTKLAVLTQEMWDSQHTNTDVANVLDRLVAFLKKNLVPQPRATIPPDTLCHFYIATGQAESWTRETTFADLGPEMQHAVLYWLPADALPY